MSKRHLRDTLTRTMSVTRARDPRRRSLALRCPHCSASVQLCATRKEILQYLVFWRVQHQLCNPKAYRCEACLGVFETEWTEEEARAEAAALFGMKDPRKEDAAVVCDSCFGNMGFPAAGQA